MQIMMDANLDLQIAAAEEVRVNTATAYDDGATNLHGSESAPPAAPTQRKSLFDLAPQILMLCSGGLQPFDFKLSPDQHHELFLVGQLFTHLHAAQLGREDGLPPVLSDEQKMKILLLILYLDPYGTP